MDAPPASAGRPTKATDATGAADAAGPVAAHAAPAVVARDRKAHARALFAPLPRHYDRVAAALSFGQDPRWRRALVAAVDAAPGERVLDVATGTGMVAQELVERYGCEVVALDQSAAMLGGARARLARRADLAARITLIEGEAERLPLADGAFDHLTFTYLLRYVADPAATLRELARVVAPGGRIASLEFAVPPNPAWRAAWRLYTQLGLPLLGRAVSREWAATGRFLARSIPDFYARYPLERVLELWRAAGIEGVYARRMSLGGGVVIWGTRGGPENRGGPRDGERGGDREDGGRGGDG
jgi:demethylmenaquinone methyltransferase/2-methoxy-6-polyprenyl-1,4-benzoquinol methylase